MCLLRFDALQPFLSLQWSRVCWFFFLSEELSYVSGNRRKNLPQEAQPVWSCRTLSFSTEHVVEGSEIAAQWEGAPGSLGQSLSIFPHSMANVESGLQIRSFHLLASALDLFEEQYPLQRCKLCFVLLTKASAIIHLPKKFGLQPDNGVLVLKFFQGQYDCLHVNPLNS